MVGYDGKCTINWQQCDYTFNLSEEQNCFAVVANTCIVWSAVFATNLLDFSVAFVAHVASVVCVARVWLRGSVQYAFIAIHFHGKPFRFSGCIQCPLTFVYALTSDEWQVRVSSVSECL